MASVTKETKENFVSLLDDNAALWLTIYGEARGEPIESQLGVGHVIINRTHERGKSIKEVCLERLQFSCWNVDDPNLQAMMSAYLGPSKFSTRLLNQIGWIAAGLQGDKFLDNTNGANHYLTTQLYRSGFCPTWAKDRKAESRVILGGHTFIWCP